MPTVIVLLGVALRYRDVWSRNLTLTACFPYPAQSRPTRKQVLHVGFVSSHLTRRLLQVMQPCEAPRLTMLRGLKVRIGDTKEEGFLRLHAS